MRIKDRNWFQHYGAGGLTLPRERLTDGIRQAGGFKARPRVTSPSQDRTHPPLPDRKVTGGGGENPPDLLGQVTGSPPAIINLSYSESHGYRQQRATTRDKTSGIQQPMRSPDQTHPTPTATIGGQL